LSDGTQYIDCADDEEDDALPLVAAPSGGSDERSFRAFGGGETMGLAQRCAGSLATLVPDRVCYITLLAGMSGRDLIMLSMSSSWWQKRVEDRAMMIPLWRYYHFHEFAVPHGDGRPPSGGDAFSFVGSLWRFVTRNALQQHEFEQSAQMERRRALLAPQPTSREYDAAVMGNRPRPRDADASPLARLPRVTQPPTSLWRVEARYRRAFVRQLRAQRHARMGPSLARQRDKEALGQGCARFSWLFFVGAINYGGCVVAPTLCLASAVVFIGQICYSQRSSVSFLLYTVTFYANLAHSLTRSP
jgi:hypothetical protein